MTLQYRADALLRPQDLEAIDKKIYEPHKEELRARSIFALKTDIPAAAETYSYDAFNRSGVAKILAPGSSDIPLVDADLERHTVDIYSIGAAFNITVHELRQAQHAGVQIETTKADTARKAIAEKENKIAFMGDADYNINGLTAVTGIQVYAVPQGAGASTKWADKTADEIVADIRKAKNKVNKLNGHTADTLIITPDSFELLEKPFNEYTKQTVLEYIRSQNWFSRIEVITDIEAQGAANSNCFVVLDSSPDVIQLGIPMDITRHPQEYAFPNYKVPFEQRTTGLIVRYPMAIVRGDGI